MGPDLSTVISEARAAAGLSQAALAKRAGISASYLSRIEGAAWERGGPWPADGVLRALARALGISSTRLVTLRRAAQADRGAAAPAGFASRAASRAPYSVSMGTAEVDAAAGGVVARTSPEGTLRSAQVYLSGCPDSTRRPSYIDAVGGFLAASPEAMLYRVCASDRANLDAVRATVGRLAGGRPAGQAANVRTRVAFANPLAFDVLVSDNEVFLGVPDRRGHPHLRAGIVIDDPDFVAAVRDWFDESVWDPPCGYADIRGEGIDDALAAIDECLLGAEQDLDPARPLRVCPRADTDQRELPGQDVPAVAG